MGTYVPFVIHFLVPEDESMNLKIFRVLFSRTIDNPLLSIFTFDSSSLETHHIATSVRFWDGQADEFFALEYVWYNSSLELFASKVKNGWKADDRSSLEA